MRSRCAIRISSSLRHVLVGEAGNVAVLFGLTIPILMGLSALAIDGATINHQKDWMQNIADEVSLATAKELYVFRDRPDELKSVGMSRAEAVIDAAGYSPRPHSVDVSINKDEGVVTVNFKMVSKSFIPAAIWSENPISVSSIARAYGSMRLCVLGLNLSAAHTIKLEKGAVLTSPQCAVQSNSSDHTSLEVKDTAHIQAAGTCAAGGITGADSIDVAPEVDCPVLDDPLAARPPPTISGCDYLDFHVDAGNSSISPGTYCGGIKMDNKAVVYAEPGIYILSGGKLDMGNETELRGDEVSFYFADDSATFEFKDKGLVELSAPKTGPMAGILFYENSNSLKGRDFKISSNSARKLLGTIYLPNAVLKIDGGGKVAEESAYTIILANRIEIKQSTLVVNADYASSDVPIPKGLGPNSSKVRLER